MMTCIASRCEAEATMGPLCDHHGSEAFEAIQNPANDSRTVKELRQQLAERWAQPLVVSSVVWTCSACPSQWEGKLMDGRVFYVRYRWGYLSIRVGKTMDDAINSGEIFGAQLGDSLDGDLSWEDVLKQGVLVMETPSA